MLLKLLRVFSLFQPLDASWMFIAKENRELLTFPHFLFIQAERSFIFSLPWFERFFWSLIIFQLRRYFFWQPLMAFHIPCLTASEPLFLTLSSLNNDYFIMLLCFLLCWKGFIFDDVSFFVVALILSLFFVVYWKYEYKEKLWELVKDFLIYK